MATTIPFLTGKGRLTFQVHPGYYYCGVRVYYCTTPPTPVELVDEPEALTASGIAGIRPGSGPPRALAGTRTPPETQILTPRRRPMEAGTTIVQTPTMSEVALDQIGPNPWQPRAGMDPDYIKELAESILAVGVLQEPLARQTDSGYQLAFGHSRIEALRELHGQGKWGATARMKISPLSDEDMAFIALEENRQRKDLTPMEEISAWAKVLRDIPGVTVQSLAKRIGVDRTTMSKNLAVLDLPDAVLALVDAGSMSVGAAQEFLPLRNIGHCHEDQIELVLRDLSGKSIWNSKPSDYRIKTVRQSIRGLAMGRAAYNIVGGFDEASRNWRPLFEGDGGGRAISFDVDAFKIQHQDHIHVLPDETGGSRGRAWTCDAKAWASWSARATREATKAEAADGKPTRGKSPGKSNAEADWWKAVKRDPMVGEVVGKRLRAAKSPRDLTEEDLARLGTRLERPRGDPTRLPQEAQPEGVTLKDRDRGARPPLFNFGQCATCVGGASWYVPKAYEGGPPQLVCTNRQAWLDKRSVGMQAWVEWKNGQIETDDAHDRKAIVRLMTRVDQQDAKALVVSMWDFLKDGNRLLPLGMWSGVDWSERERYSYWPAGAKRFGDMAHLELPDNGGYAHKGKWEREAWEWMTTSPDGTDWSMALASLQVWKARIAWGMGADIWGAVGIPTVAQEVA